MPIAFHLIIGAAANCITSRCEYLDQNTDGVRLRVRLNCSDDLAGNSMKCLCLYTRPRIGGFADLPQRRYLGGMIERGDLSFKRHDDQSLLKPRDAQSAPGMVWLKFH